MVGRIESPFLENAKKLFELGTRVKTVDFQISPENVYNLLPNSKNIEN